MTILMFGCGAVSAVAKNENIEHADYGIVIDELYKNGEYQADYFPGNPYCFIRNEYYKHFADYYFEKQYAFYNEAYDYWTGEKTNFFYYEKKTFITDSENKNKTFSDDLSKDEFKGHIYYETVIFDYDGKADASKNKMLAESLSEGMEVLYIGTTTPCAVVAIRGGTQDFINIVENKNVEFFFLAFVDSDVRGVNESIFEETYSPDSAHARKVLRYSARLEKAPEEPSEAKEFFFMSDTDFDGKITAADARTALRIAAKLEKGHTLMNRSSGCGAWWGF